MLPLWASKILSSSYFYSTIISAVKEESFYLQSNSNGLYFDESLTVSPIFILKNHPIFIALYAIFSLQFVSNTFPIIRISISVISSQVFVIKRLGRSVF